MTHTARIPGAGIPAKPPEGAAPSFSHMQRKLLGKPLSLLHHHDKQERR
jgi:hypothetical protein